MKSVRNKIGLPLRELSFDDLERQLDCYMKPSVWPKLQELSGPIFNQVNWMVRNRIRNRITNELRN